MNSGLPAKTTRIGKSTRPYKAWGFPYGITNPGKPTGRFSDGNVLTDYVGKFLELECEISTYRGREEGNRTCGMNFAYGGTGVFDTIFLGPNMTTQIDFLQQLINISFFTPSDLHSSVALVTLGGNDYTTFLARNGSYSDLPAFIPQVVNQLVKNLERIYSMGLSRVAVTGLGCFPRNTQSPSFQSCDAAKNAVAENPHNSLLKEAVTRINALHPTDSVFVVLDLYASFMSVIENGGSGAVKFENPLQPCCVGISAGYLCGSVNESGAKMYTLCDNPSSKFFWDNVHPTQAGWNAVYTALNATLLQLYQKLKF
ncbi:GDSL esterase/lipase At5g03610-like isoform X1 [Malania oleifera]|uniref:GDSL esterase/lipase At5g03610-like isoform X1 n=1 Tax=Malania oleifera TaxID=397392 RepID=UPI0025AE1100|nr:GDSL esterase/lipase At5g03610-like isoform X1 [Malania oleifera]